ncbi:MAG TPA: hypothetical protein VIO61_10550 [Anaerolineaceae bacterium]
MTKNYLSFILIFSLLLLVSLACQVNLGGPKLPGTSVPFSTSPAQTLQVKFGNTFSTPLAPGKSTSLVISEQELTSIINSTLAQNPDVPIKNVQIRFHDQKMELYGVVQSDLAVANANLVLLPYIDAAGNIQFSILSANLGPLPVFSFILKWISTIINNALNESFTINSNAIKFEKITITEGQMSITMTVK